ncbi:hypothetical protein [Chitinophaga deserti]|uniref:hypothetical protein n=1 Tax=Chitinophaga deserti TaxID=2164099 RepID=UPI001300BBE6|nr:hypothetical protein [Chitinophaga deserti]
MERWAVMAMEMPAGAAGLLHLWRGVAVCAYKVIQYGRLAHADAAWRYVLLQTCR